MKSGANFEDRNRINEMSEDGMSAEEISQRLGIELKAVKGHMPKPKAKPKAKAKDEGENPPGE